MYKNPNDIKSNSVCPAEICPDCHLQKKACLCRCCPQIRSKATFFILVHERELEKPTNTGHLIINALPQSHYDVWSRSEPSQSLQVLLNSSGLAPCLLFPADYAMGVQNSTEPVSHVTFFEQQSQQQFQQLLQQRPHNESRDPLFILLDGTWQQAKKMYRQTLALQKIPLMSVGQQKTSQYRLRKNQAPGNLSTAEVAVECLRRTGEISQADALHQYYLKFMQHFEASRSNHAPENRVTEG